MRFRFSALAVGCAVFAIAASAVAQSLADIAKKEEERRKQTPAAGKVYTNKDLAPVPPSSTPPADPSILDSSAAKDGDKSADKADKSTGDKSAGEKDAKAADDKKPAGEVRDQKYWKDRMTAAQLALDRDSGYAEAMQTRINALTTDFVNRDDPAQRSVIEQNRNKALAELDRLKKQVVDDRKAIADLEEEARRAGVPPGWLR